MHFGQANGHVDRLLSSKFDKGDSDEGSLTTNRKDFHKNLFGFYSQGDKLKRRTGL